MSLAPLQHVGYSVASGLRTLGAALAGLLLQELAERLGLSRPVLQMLAGVMLAGALCKLWLFNRQKRCSFCTCRERPLEPL